MVNLLTAAALAAATPAAAPPPDQPAIFKVQDADTTIYLFGTFHALDGDGAWLDPAVRTAFEQSDELVLETLLPESGAPHQAGVPVRAPSVVASGSYLATTRMALNAGRSQGMHVANGADMVLRHLAEADGKRVEGLETLDLQLRMFDKLRIAAPMQPAARRAPISVKPADTMFQTMGQMEAAWKRGDQDVFARIIEQLRTESPDTYRMNVHRAECPLGRLGRSADAEPGGGVRGRRRRTPGRQGQPARAPCRTRDRVAPGRLTPRSTCLFGRPPLVRAFPAMVIPGGVARGISNRRIAK